MFSDNNKKILKQIRAIAEKQRLLSKKLKLDLIKEENNIFQKIKVLQKYEQCSSQYNKLVFGASGLGCFVNDYLWWCQIFFSKRE